MSVDEVEKEDDEDDEARWVEVCWRRLEALMMGREDDSLGIVQAEATARF